MSRFIVGFSFLSLLFFTGCGSSNPYGTVVVKGHVDLDGKAIDRVCVTFSPVAGDGMSASGMTDAQGNYVLTTGGAPFGSGAVPGEYKVTLSKVTNTGSELSVDEYNAQIASGLRPASGPMSRAVHLIPEKYSKADTAGLDPVTVGRSASKNVFNFDLKSDGS